jgi:hypothetical protein
VIAAAGIVSVANVLLVAASIKPVKVTLVPLIETVAVSSVPSPNEEIAVSVSTIETPVTVSPLGLYTVYVTVNVSAAAVIAAVFMFRFRLIAAPLGNGVSASPANVPLEEAVAKVTAEVVAEAGDTAAVVPKANAATMTSAMRLNVVFVDIFFLSIVDPRTIRGSA